MCLCTQLSQQRNSYAASRLDLHHALLGQHKSYWPLTCWRTKPFRSAGVLTETTAELALSLTFAAARRIVEADRFMRGGKYEGWLPNLFVGNLLQRKTVGIVGAGRIGTAYARMMMEGHKCNLVYYDPYPNKFLEEYVAEYAKVGGRDLVCWYQLCVKHVQGGCCCFTWYGEMCCACGLNRCLGRCMEKCTACCDHSSSRRELVLASPWRSHLLDVFNYRALLKLTLVSCCVMLCFAVLVLCCTVLCCAAA